MNESLAMPLAVVALGSNLGDSATLVREAMDRVEQLAGVPVRRSSLWRTTPVDCPPGSPVFVNAVVGFPVPMGWVSRRFLESLQALEREFGRRPKTVHNEARPLDLDLIVWGDERQTDGFLTLPHPRAHERRFVLEPLAEIAPGLRWPGRGVSVTELLQGLPPDPAMRRGTK